MKYIQLVVFFIFFLTTSIFAQENNFNLKYHLEKSFNDESEEIVDFDCDINDPNKISQLLAKDTWRVTDLDVITCLLEKANKSSNKNLQAHYYFIASNAFNDFDEDLKVDFSSKAYMLYSEIEDIEGKYLSLFRVMNAKIVTMDSITAVEKKLVEKGFYELEEIAQATDYPYVQLKFEQVRLTKITLLNEKISEQYLDSLYKLAANYKTKYPSFTRTFYTNLAMNYGREGLLSRKLAVEKEALELANPLRKDYPSFLVNIGTTHIYLGEYDSAQYYFKRAYKKTPAKPDNSYTFSLKKNLESNIASLSKYFKEMDSAYYYAINSKITTDEQRKFQLNEKRVYADKKFELDRKELEIAKRDLALLQQRKNQTYLLAGGSAVLALSLVLLYFNRRTKQLERQAVKLAKNREQLLRVVSHDLVFPLQVFSSTASLLPKLIEKGKFEKVASVQESMKTTIISLNDLLSNLFAWGEQLKATKTSALTEIELKEQIEQIQATYAPLAAERNIEINSHNLCPISIKSDAVQVTNLLRNLIFNAVKHASGNSEILLSLERINNNEVLFSCTNKFSEAKRENALKLVESFNNNQKTVIASSRLGMEIIFHAVQKLGLRLQGEIYDDTIQLGVVFV